jgi:hypothetical protein
MLEKRRNFLITSVATVASLVSGSFAALGQSRRKIAARSADARRPQNSATSSPILQTLKPRSRPRCQNREREFREDVDKLVQLSNELRDELNTTPASNVLSVKMYKRVQEIAKLAKQMESTLNAKR